ncbi:MAG: hypothetical protein V3R16_10635 [Nitrospirales bacterium]
MNSGIQPDDDYVKSKRTVEECLRLDIGALSRSGLLSSEPGASGVLKQRDGPLVEYQLVESSPEQLALRLIYCAGGGSGGRGVVDFDYVIALEPTPCNFGGHRWWFGCPGLHTAAGHCGRRCGTLYFPPDSGVFACRTCHGLSYQSQTRRDKVYLDYLRPMNQLERINARLEHTRKREERGRLRTEAELLRQRLEQFLSWARDVKLGFVVGRSVAAWEPRAADRAYDVFLKVMRRPQEGMGGEYSVFPAFGETKKVESVLRGSEEGP